MPSEVFYGYDDQPMSARQIAAARAVCRSCPVVRDCLITAVKTNEPYGVWGGFTAFERKAAIARRNGNLVFVMADYDKNQFIQPRRRRK